MTPTNEQLEALEKLNRDRTQGEWNLGNTYLYPDTPYVHTTMDDGMGGPTLLKCFGEEEHRVKYNYIKPKENAEFIALSANLTGPVIEEIRRLRTEVEILRYYGNKTCIEMADERIEKGDWGKE